MTYVWRILYLHRYKYIWWQVISRKDQAQYWAREDEEHAYVSTKQFADKFKEFHIGIALQTELNVPFDKSRSHPFALTKTKFGTNKMVILKACVSREFLLMKRNFLVFCFKLLQVSYTKHYYIAQILVSYSGTFSIHGLNS